MKDTLDSKSGSMDIVLSSFRTAKYFLKSKGSTAASHFTRPNILHTLVSSFLVKNMCSSAKMYKNELRNKQMKLNAELSDVALSKRHRAFQTAAAAKRLREKAVKRSFSKHQKQSLEQGQSSSSSRPSKAKRRQLALTESRFLWNLFFKIKITDFFFLLTNCKVLDAWGKTPSGVLEGNVRSFGDFRECSKLEYSLARRENERGSKQVKGLYCVADIRFFDDGSHVVIISLTQGLCLPASCTDDDVNTLIDHYIRFDENYQKKYGPIMNLAFNAAHIMPCGGLCSFLHVMGIFFTP
ncbi:nose resistant to fluoxetine protein 6-like [Plakobranchus ocellatus]|uniref:Nose resistant to fluoxetine protein 6-like n=1 Tax=Plakobranchus ocellatus TaxID=259542 RepID=A0AAV3Z1Z0_9GAST|nr:nose resistant to fluoxetine protein 6-like [Plakobranchus ocellatus]